MIKNIEIKRKKVKNVTLKVKIDGSVHLTVPLHVTEEYIIKFLESKMSWIEEKVKYFEEKHKDLKVKEIIEGEIIRYLGEDYKIKVIESTKEKVVLNHDIIEIYSKDKNNSHKNEDILNNWYKNEAKKIFNELIDKYCKILNEEVSSIRISKMKTRWGSCNSVKKNINLNLELIKKPMASIEYVIVHELAHLKHPNHSRNFWCHVSDYMPDWKERRESLRNGI